MSNNVKTKNDEEIMHFLNASDRMIKGIDALRKRNRPMLQGQRDLTDEELSRRLHLNPRTLKEYPDTGLIPFLKFGGKFLYIAEHADNLL